MKNIAIPLALLIAATGAPVHAEDFEQHIAADLHGEIDVSNVAGTVDISAWDKPEVEVKADVSSSQRVQVESDKSRRISIVVKGRAGSGWFGGDHGATLRLRVPSGSEINLSAVSADVHSRGVTGRQSLQTVSGEIQADIADAEVKTVSGDLRLKGSGAPQRMRINSISGDVTLTNAAGDLEATTVSGDLRATLGAAHTINMRSTSGALQFTGRLAHDGSLEAQTVSGEVKLQLPAESGYDYEIRSFSGDIEDCFGQKAERTSTYGPGTRLMGTRGQAGAARLRVKTLSGDISLCDKGG
jgi:DUF4097 and DUF4098 domain-containing protein YvlB